MSYIYEIELNSYLSDEEIKPADLCRCSLSSRNILALSNDCSVYLLPLEKPNELVPVCLSSSPCLDLTWSHDGLFLLIVTKTGGCNLYNIKTNLLNSIDLVFTYQINKIEMASVKPFSKLPKLCFNAEKSESLNYYEKYYYNQSFKCLKNLGDSFSNGFVLLTKSGMIHIFVTDFNSVKNRFQKYDYDMKLKDNFKSNQEDRMDFQSQVGDHQGAEENEIVTFDLGDFCYESDGSILVAFTNSDAASSIYVYRVTIKLESEIVGLVDGSTELISVINSNESSGSKSSLLFSSINSAKFLAVLSNQNTLNFWEHSNNRCNWDLANRFHSEASIVNINMPKSKESFKEEKAYILVSYENSTIGYINYETYAQEYVLPALAAKRNRPQNYVITFDQSFSGCIGVGITNNSSLVSFRRFIPANDFPIRNQKSLLDYYEYYMVAGYDYWDLLISTNPKMIEYLITALEKTYFNQTQSSIKKAYFSRVYSLIYSLSRRSTIENTSDYKALDILIKLVLNRSILNIANAIQFNLNVDSLTSQASSYLNTSIQPPLIKTSIINSNIDVLSINPNLISPSLNHVPFKTNLNEYLSDVLSLDHDATRGEVFNLNEIVQSILSRKFASISLSQQIKHIFQWIIDVSLFLITEVTIVINKMPSKSLCAASLLNDHWFLNELRKGLVFLKLIQTVSQTNGNNGLISSSSPVLPFKSLCSVFQSQSSPQKDVISDIFNILTKLIARINSGETTFQEGLINNCLALHADLITKTRFEEKIFNLKQTWFGSSKTSWVKTFQIPVDYLFEIEKFRDPSLLFDIIRLVEFSRSTLTKQCLRCGNYTEASQPSLSSAQSTNQANANNSSAKSNSANLQDLASDKCVCGGFWVLSSILQ